MSANGHIVSVQNKNTHGENMFEPLTSEMWLIAPTIWASFIAYLVWYLTKAKHYVPISRVEAKQLWAIHIHNNHCNSRKWRQIRHRGRTVGFECGCGFKHLQQRPIVAPSAPTSVATQTSTYNTLQPSQRTP